MKTIKVEEKKGMEKTLLKHFQNQLPNIKVFLLSISLLFFIGSSTNILASTEKNKGLISKFYELAKDKDADVRTELAETVGKTGKPEALKLLEEMAKDKDPDVRRAVVKALGQTGRPEALKLLEKIMKNESKKEKQPPHYSANIKETAIEAIMKINREATSFLAYYPSLQKEKTETQNKKRSYYGKRRYLDKNIYNQMIQKAKNKQQVKKQTINLAKQTKEKVFQLLNKLSTDKKENIRMLVAKNTPQIEDPIKTLKLLEKIMKNEYKQPNKQSRYSSIKGTLIESIVKIHQETTTFLIHLGNEKEQKENQKKRRYYGKNYTGFYQQIIQYAKNKGRAETQAIHLADQTKKKVFQLLNILAKDKSTKVRSEVAVLIKKIKNPTKALNLLEKMIKSEHIYNSKDKYYNVKKQAIESSTRIYKRANNFLAYLDYQTKTQKKKNRYSYRSIGDIGIYNQMIQLSTNKKRAEKQAIKLANQTKKKILQSLNTLVKDKDVNVRKKVVEVMVQIDNADATNLLEKMIKDKATDVRKAVVKTLKIMYSPKTPSWKYVEVNKILKKNISKAMHLLEKLAKDKDKDVRISTIKAMGKLSKN